MSDFLNEIAWRDFITWASRDPDTIARFKAQTASQWPEVENEAGMDSAQFFIEWATEEMWRLDNAPDAIREVILGPPAEIIPFPSAPAA